MVEKYSATKEQLTEVQNILRLLDSSLDFTLAN
jgi:hypothetical protein